MCLWVRDTRGSLRLHETSMSTSRVGEVDDTGSNEP